PVPGCRTPPAGGKESRVLGRRFARALLPALAARPALSAALRMNRRKAVAAFQRSLAALPVILNRARGSTPAAPPSGRAANLHCSRFPASRTPLPLTNTNDTDRTLFLRCPNVPILLRVSVSPCLRGGCYCSNAGGLIGGKILLHSTR